MTTSSLMQGHELMNEKTTCPDLDTCRDSCRFLVTTNGKNFLKISDPDGILPGKQPQILSPKEFLEKMNA